jgi:hypothetical protein
LEEIWVGKVVLLRSEDWEGRKEKVLVLLTDLLHLAVPQHLGDLLQDREFRSNLRLLAGSDDSH